MVNTSKKDCPGQRGAYEQTTRGRFERTALRVGAIEALEVRAAHNLSRRTGVTVQRILERRLGATLSRKIRSAVKRANQTCARCGAARGSLGNSSREFKCRCAKPGLKGQRRVSAPSHRRSLVGRWR